MLAVELRVGVASEITASSEPYIRARRELHSESRMLATEDSLPSAFQLEVSLCQLRVTKTWIFFCKR